MAGRKKLHPLATVFIIAIVLLAATLIVLYTFLGMRYINDKTHELKFLGSVDGEDVISGKLYYYNGRIASVDARDKTIEFEDGELYRGALSGYLPHGKGTLTKADGSIYEGDFYEGYATGKLNVTYPNGDVYMGDLDHEVRNGKGKYISADGAVYEGDFYDGEKNGFGRTAFSDGSVYIGQYNSSVKNGVGAYLFKNGDIYVGDFAGDMRTGRGIYLWAKSEEYSSEFDSLFSTDITDGFEESFVLWFDTDFDKFFTEEEKGEIPQQELSQEATPESESAPAETSTAPEVQPTPE
ncbi:MAG: hypothetical protein IKY62_00210, partial [Clostridia bacterium]|nr:hypothetical protein [Clostridia bacterium]